LALADVPYDSLGIGNLTTVTIPFSSFYSAIHPITGIPGRPSFLDTSVVRRVLPIGSSLSASLGISKLSGPSPTKGRRLLLILSMRRKPLDWYTRRKTRRA
jgi:hypothetical protein